jgi:hypothetical protein
MKLISWWGKGKNDQPLICSSKIVEFGIAGQPLDVMQISGGFSTMEEN